MLRYLWLAVIALVGQVALGAAPLPVSPEEMGRWRDGLIPLPHQIAINGKVAIHVGDVAVRLTPDAGEVERQAAGELRELLHAAGRTDTGNPRFEIIVGVLDVDGCLAGVPVGGAAKLKSLPHNGQAYLIAPKDDSKLLVGALKPAGVYYGVQTLKQLLHSRLTGQQVEIPLAEVIDWPDMDERGLWNFDMDLIPWLASLKLNFAKIVSTPETIQAGKPVQAKIRPGVAISDPLRAARLRAMHGAATVAHLNYIGQQHGAYAAYPALAGQGDGAVPNCGLRSRDIRVPCASCPVLKTLIAEYISSLAAQGAREVSVWLSEHDAQCQCPPCLAAGQFRTETEAALAGWRLATRSHPGLELRLFYCFGGKSREDTYQCLMALPPEVKIEHCYGRYRDAFDAAAGQGRWLASYAGPPLPGSETSGLRFHALSATRDLVRRLTAAKWNGVYSINYVYSSGAYQKELYGLHVAALAEFTWNLKGRTAGDLARAWAASQGWSQPDRFAAWIEAMEPVEAAASWSLRSPLWNKVPDEIRARRPGRLGADLYWGFPKKSHFDDRRAACRRATAIAQAAGRPELAHESLYAEAVIRALAAVAELQARAAESTPQGRGQAETALAELRAAVADMIREMDAKTDLLKAEPRSYATTIKKLHADLWQGRLKAIAAVVQSPP